MLDVLVKGGIMMIPLMLCSVIALAIIVERSINLRKKKIIRPEIVDIIENIKGPDDVNLALALCREDGGVFSKIIRIGLENLNSSREYLREVLEDQGRQEMRGLERGLVILEIVAGIAPLLGLLGTVLGMMHVFDVITFEGVGSAKNLSAGISEALITTVAGLIIAIPALVAYTMYMNKVEGMVLEIEKFTAQLLAKHKIFQKIRQSHQVVND